MTTTVSTDFGCIYIVPGHEPVQGHMLLDWEMNSPMQVTVTFDNANGTKSVWIMSRDMFADAMINQPGPIFGGGDALLDRGIATFHLKLHSPEGDASVTFPIAPVIPFMTQTLQYVPRGEQEYERIATELDAFLKDVLDNEG